MSGGKLVVLDRAGREVKQYDLPSGSAILGSDSSCDIRIMLPSVRPHHATVLVQANQSVIRNVGSGETLLNGVSVSVAVLRQDDVVSLGGRELVWRYAHPAPHHARRRPDSPALQSVRVGRPSRGGRGRRSEGAGPRPPHASHRDSAPGAVSTRQVAIVQPQRRDTADHIESVSNSAVSVVTHVRRRGTVKSDSETDTSLNKSIEEMNKTKSPKSSPVNLQNTTKATLWIESRKSSPRKSLAEIPARLAITSKKTFSAKKSTPLRMAVLKKAQSEQKLRVTKIQAPLTIDHTKQVAIMLMTGHTPKAKATPARKASLVVAKRPRGRPSKATTSLRGSSASDTSLGSHISLDQSRSVMEISDSDTGQSTMCESDDASLTGRLSSGSICSSTVSPIKSALKDPRKISRKTESIKFDLSNLDEPPSPEDKNIRLRYSESPSPRSVQSRARDILRRTLGSEENITSGTSSPAQVKSPSSPRLSRGSMMLHRALRNTSPNQMESYSIVDLVSGESNSSLYGSASDTSRYNTPANSGRATRATSLLVTSTPAVPKLSRSRSAVTSTSYTSIRDDSQITYCSEVSRRSKSLSTPVNTPGNGTYNVSAKKKSQAPVNASNVADVTFNVLRRSRQSLVTPDISKENLTDNNSLSTAEDTTATLNASTKSRRTRSTLTGEEGFEHITLNSTRSRSQNGTQMSEVNMTSVRNISKSESPKHDGTLTPKNQQSPEEAGTPVLSIQSLLDSDKNATLPQQSKRTRPMQASLKRKTIGGRISLPRKRGSVKSKSLRLSTRASKSSYISPDLSDNTEEVLQADHDTTPKSAVKLVQEAVKNKHSTAKKPKSKRSIIDHLNESDIVKQLFNSPVKRKLSQSMIEYSRRQDLDGDMIPKKKVTRKTIAFGETTPDNSISEPSQVITPEVFVSPLSTPSASPELEGVKRLFAKSSPENDLRNVRGVKKLMQTPRVRRSVRNDLTQVSGVKAVFARSPKNRLSDVRVKEVFATSPKNDLRSVSGVKSLFQTEKKKKSPKNDLSDVANVRDLYKKSSPRNDLGNVSGVKTVMRKNSPRNDLGDVRGVRNLFHLEKQRDDLNNISGIEELFESHQTSNATDANSESSFNLLIGMPAVRSYKSKAKSFSLKTIQKPKHRKTKSLQASFSSISNNVEDWLENELRKRMHNGEKNSASTKKALEKTNDENMFDSKSSKSDKSSSIISKSMSRSKHILELSMSGRTGRKSANNNTNTVVEGNTYRIDATNNSINKSKRHMSRSRNETASNNASFTVGDNEIPAGNITQLDASNNSPNNSKSNRATPKKNISRSQNKSVNNSDNIVDDHQLQRQVTPRKSLDKSKNRTATNKSDILDANEIYKENTKNNKSTNQFKTHTETPRKPVFKSKSTTNRSRELLKLATDTVEGNTPLLATRIRHSTLTKTISDEGKGERVKSTSEIYSAHTLPIKKRSLVDRDTSGNRSEKSVLPIKKRAVVHSTPVKGRYNLTMNASEIGRVSPIASLIEESIVDDINPTNRTTQETKISPERKMLLARSSNVDVESEARKEKTSPVPIRSSRRQTKQGLAVNNVKKRRSSIVITKKAPVLSPKSSINISTNVPAVLENTEPTKKARGRNVTRKREKEMPVSTDNVAPNQNESMIPKTKSGRKTNIEKDNFQNITQQPSDESLPKPRNTRGRKVAAAKVLTPKKVTRTKSSKVGIVIAKPSPLMKPSTKTVNDREETPIKRLPQTRNVQAETCNQPDNTRKRSKSKAPGNSKAKTPESQDSSSTRNTRNTRKGTENNAKQLQLETQPNTKSRRGGKADIQSNKVDSKEPETQKRSIRGTGPQDTNVNSKTKLRKTSSKDNSKTSDSVALEKSSRGHKRKIQVEESPKMINKSKTDDVSSKKKQKIDKEPIETKQRKRGRPKKKLESNENIEAVKESATRRVREVTETTDVNNERVSRKKAESKTVQSETTKTSKKSATGKKESEQIDNETDEIRNVRGRKKQPEIKNKENATESKKTTRRGQGDEAAFSEETIPETEQNRTRRQQVKAPEKPEGKTKSAQEVSKSEKATMKRTTRQKVVEPEKMEARATRGVKTTEPEKLSAGRKRKNGADDSTPKESTQPAKTRKTSAVSPKAKRARNTKVEEPQKPATRSRRR